MRRWLLLLGGLIVWAAHFLGVYGIASVADVLTRADAPAALWSVAAFTLLCAGADLAIGVLALRGDRGSVDGLDRLIHRGGAGGAALSLVAVLWQGLPILFTS
ncbi:MULTISPECIES: hypothetical protein [unclassified Phenylobacterium]|uniref:hypothetical protein n=1 Tax=unclassified Phenylobacterium TaxID=2640670 RepID=UPI00083BA41F|nr:MULTISPECIES: hypothetical protein [unclassified Phenylobacterium]